MSALDRSYEEKRDFIRMRVNSPITIKHNGNTHTGICKDLSGTGLLVETDATLSIDDECIVNIEQEDETRRGFHAEVKVNRVDSNGDGNNSIGFSITEILP